MSIDDYRFRNEGALLVLQVLSTEKDTYFNRFKEEWRDAKTEDLLDVAELMRTAMKSEPRITGSADCGPIFAHSE